jgi:NAD(P)-dependent dehydrogenase (short-subunit alcohol dehydrogenase family)
VREWLGRRGRQAARRLVAAEKGGVVLNVSSILGQRPGTLQASYGAAKAGLDQLTRVMVAMGDTVILAENDPNDSKPTA